MKTSHFANNDNKAVVLPILRDAAKKNVKFSPAFAVSDDKGYSSVKTIGTVESDPQPVKVNNEYIYQDGKWKLLKVEFSLE